MKVNVALLLAAIPMAAADAFVTPSPLAPVGTAKRASAAAVGHATTPLTSATSKNQRIIAPWSTSALEMSGGGGGGGDVVASEGTSTIPDEVFNLVKSIIGAGVLSLPAGELSCSLSLTRL